MIRGYESLKSNFQPLHQEVSTRQKIQTHISSGILTGIGIDVLSGIPSGWHSNWHILWCAGTPRMSWHSPEMAGKKEEEEEREPNCRVTTMEAEGNGHGTGMCLKMPEREEIPLAHSLGSSISRGLRGSFCSETGRCPGDPSTISSKQGWLSWLAFPQKRVKGPGHVAQPRHRPRPRVRASAQRQGGAHGDDGDRRRGVRDIWCRRGTTGTHGRCTGGAVHDPFCTI